ncbi:hypothetical protein V6N13_018743 [Hibiscus sabdariffa]
MTPIVSSWFSSASCAIKFNFDTSFTSSTKEAFSGVVARNSTGLIMAACLLHHSDVNDFFIAKARACEDAVNFAIELGFRSIHGEGDSLTKITFSHVGRQGNEAAHVLAKANRRFQLPRYWIEEASLEVERVALRDIRK